MAPIVAIIMQQSSHYRHHHTALIIITIIEIFQITVQANTLYQILLHNCGGVLKRL